MPTKFQTAFAIDQDDLLGFLGMLVTEASPVHLTVSPLGADSMELILEHDAVKEQIRLILDNDGTWTARSILTVERA